MAKTRMSASRTDQKPPSNGEARKYVSQADVPRYLLSDALRVPLALAENYGKAPTKPLLVADALGMTPTSGTFRMLCGASIGYGLTEGGYNAAAISLTPLGVRIVAPQEEGEDASAMKEAFLRPRLIREFLSKYDNSRLPPDRIAQNVLESMGVPQDASRRILEIIQNGARQLGLLRDIKGQTYVDLEGEAPAVDARCAPSSADDEAANSEVLTESSVAAARGSLDTKQSLPEQRAARRVFITHGKNRSILDQLREIVRFGRFEPIIAVEHETPSMPVPEKVLADMRSCFAAIIHVASEKVLFDEKGKPEHKLNENVLIEIGAAMALYGRNFILLVEEAIQLPSNLQGLYLCRYSGDRLDGEATMRLLKAFNEFQIA